ncbi:hypothetical protein ACLB2K_058419 [Fragaria x ananassa]
MACRLGLCIALYRIELGLMFRIQPNPTKPFRVLRVLQFQETEDESQDLAKGFFLTCPPLCDFLLGFQTEWHAVAAWTWDAQDETCGICRMAFDGCCPDCKLPGDDCPLIWGACNMHFIFIAS